MAPMTLHDATHSGNLIFLDSYVSGVCDTAQEITGLSERLRERRQLPLLIVGAASRRPAASGRTLRRPPSG